MKTCVRSALTSAAAAAAAATLLAGAPAARAADTLFERPAALAENAVANGTRFQAPLLAETFDFSGIADELSWWGSAGSQFSVRIFSFGDPSSPVLVATPFFGVLPQEGELVIDGVATPIFRFSLPLGGLAGGAYGVSIEETVADDAGRTWYWVQASPSVAGDGTSVAGLGEPDQLTNNFDLSLRVVGVVPEPSSWALMLAGAAVLAGLARQRR